MVAAIALSPNGSQIALSLSTKKSRDTFNLWVMLAAGGNPRQLTHGWSITSVAWSPDGRLIAASANRPPDFGGRGHLLVVNTADDSVRDLTPGGLSVTFPAWVPNSHNALSFAAAHSAAAAPFAVGEITLSGARVRRLTPFGAENMTWFQGHTQRFVFGAQGGLYITQNGGAAVVESCTAAHNCQDMEPLTLFDSDGVAGFVTSFANQRPPEVDAIGLGSASARRVLIEPSSSCCTAWWPGPSR